MQVKAESLLNALLLFLDMMSGLSASLKNGNFIGKAKPKNGGKIGESISCVYFKKTTRISNSFVA